MYIGSTDARGLHHLVWEVVDNSIDEAMAGYASHIEVRVLEDGSVRVVDNGRGVPVGRHSSGKDALEVVHTKLHAGGKFGGGGYKVSGGLHGVGVSVVNALSEFLRVESLARRFRLGAGILARHADDACPQGRAARATVRGTMTLFKPDPKVFETVEFSFDTIAQRLRESAYLNKGLWIRLVDERADRERSFYFEGGLVSFVRHLNRNKETLQQPADLRRDAGRLDYDRGRAPVQRLLHGEHLHLRQQHQHRRRRHAPDRLPGRPDAIAQRLRPARGHPQGRRRQPLRATTSARA